MKFEERLTSGLVSLAHKTLDRKLYGCVMLGLFTKRWFYERNLVAISGSLNPLMGVNLSVKCLMFRLRQPTNI